LINCERQRYEVYRCTGRNYVYYIMKRYAAYLSTHESQITSSNKSNTMSSSKRPLSSPTFQSSKRQQVHRETDGELPEQIHDQPPEKIISVDGNKVI
jgi:hypothetical protein